MKKSVFVTGLLVVLFFIPPSYSQDFSIDIQTAKEYYNKGQYAEAAVLFEKWLSPVKEEYGAMDTSIYAPLLSRAGICFHYSGQYKKALPYYEETTKIYKAVLGEKHPDYATSLNNLALLYQDMGNYSAALPLYEEALNIRKEALGTDHPDYATSLNNLALLYYAMGNYSSAEPLYKQANLIMNQNIEDNFSFLSPKEKENYINTIGYNYEVYNSFITRFYSDTSDFCNQAYNNELLQKGLILNSITAQQEVIMKSSDTALINDYNTLLSLKQQIVSWQQKPVSERTIDLSVLETQANDLEKILTRESSDFAQIKQQFSIKWQDVKQILLPDESAIEFISFDYHNGKKWTDSTLYCALVLRSFDTIPRMVYLCEESQLKKAIPKTDGGKDGINLAYRGKRSETMEPAIDSVYSRGALYGLIWKPLDSLLQGIKTVYFAPSGLLHRVAMAAITCPDSTLLMDRYNLVQLSSTRTLALPEKEPDIRSAVVYGGIQYDTDTASLLTEAAKYPGEENNLMAYHHPTTKGADRNGFEYLEGAQREAEQIADMLNKKGITVTTYSGTKANEESFQALSGDHAPSVIHLSTHGFYFPDTITSKQNREQLLFNAIGGQRFRLSDDPLLRSGLVMAGGNIVWKGKPIPAGIEDGILTAKEVSNMNLMNTQLVVLSACQTGLGDVKGNEGVEGLLRGFKMAGVRYLMMSLWEVPDDETAEFMETFYREWLSGKPMRQAFLDTQKIMRSNYKGEPYKWAAFVMVE